MRAARRVLAEAGPDAIAPMYEAILQAQHAKELYQRMCDAAVGSGQFLTVAMLTVETDASWAQVVAVAGVGTRKLRDVRVSFGEPGTDGRVGVSLALHSGVSQTGLDLIQGGASLHWQALVEAAGILAAAVIPILRDNRVVAALLLCSSSSSEFEAESVQSLDRLANNIGHALERYEQDAKRQHMLDRLKLSNERYKAIVDSLDDAYYEVDLTGKPLYYNCAFSKILGYSHEELMKLKSRERQTPDMALVIFKVFSEVYMSRKPKKKQEWEYIHKNGSKVVVEGSVAIMMGDDGSPSGFNGILHDVTEQRKIHHALRLNEDRYRALVHLSSDWDWEQDENFCFTRIESRVAQIDSMHELLIGKPIWDNGFEIHGALSWGEHRALMAAHGKFRDVVMRHPSVDGRPYYISVSGEPVFDSDGIFLGYRGVAREITDQKIAEEHIQYLATHDGLTALPNRLMFSKLLAIAILTAARYKRRFAVLFIDLDHFKVVNDTLGHEVGDLLLKEISTRFKQTLRSSDVIARLGGDEFVVLLQEINEPKQAAVAAKKILLAAQSSFVLMGNECQVTGSIGISLYPGDGTDEQALMKNADIGMYLAKEDGKNNFKFYSKELNT